MPQSARCAETFRLFRSPKEPRSWNRWNRGDASSNQNAGRNGVDVGKGAATFVWTVLPYRTEWRYAFLSPKIIAQDAGHLCQNLYLACEAIGAGTCGIDAYDQAELDTLLGVDGCDEYAVYAAPVGRVKP